MRGSELGAELASHVGELVDLSALMRLCPQCGSRFDGLIQYCPNDGSQTYEALAEAPLDPLLGQVIDGRYRIEQKIGEGGMGLVYSAIHTTLGKRFALKVLRGESSRDAELVQRFLQEAQAATSIGHANIVDISDSGRLPDGSVYFVMEYLEGLSLSDTIKRRGSVPMNEAIHIARQIASALEAAHARGIVHRDLKPDNIFIVQRDNDPRFVKVLDFGVAKVGGAAGKLTKTGMVFGTPHYMSPEQAAGNSVDQRTDVYALGVIMYEMLSGKVPFDADTFMGILSKHMFEPPPRPTDISGGALGPLEAVILRALEKNPDRRYHSMAELLADLDTIAAGGSVHAPSRSDIASTHAFPASGQAVFPASEPERGGSVWLVALALFVLLVVGGGVGVGVYMWVGDGENEVLAQGPVEATPRPSPPDSENSEKSSADSTESGSVSPERPSGPAEKPPAPEPQPVRITSIPEGAEVLLDGAMIGNTPVTVPRPTEGSQTFTLRLRGHRDAQLRLDSESNEALQVTLEPERQPAVRPSGPRRRRASAQTEAQPQQSPQTSPRPSSDVIDPWAN